MRRRKLALAVGVALIAIFSTVAILPILRPRHFFWASGESELTIQGFCPPTGGKRGIHYDKVVDWENLRTRCLAIDFGFVAWEFVFTKHLPTNGSNHAMEQTAGSYGKEEVRFRKDETVATRHPVSGR
jgi:hypothetical protein